MSVAVGQLIDGKYRVLRALGRGGMGAVFEGENRLISRRVAIKVLHPELLQKRDLVYRFELEAQAAGRIENDHILEVLDLGTLPGGPRYMVMEFLDGETLQERIRRVGRLPPRQAASLLRQTLVGLAAAHRVGIVHRDLKPGNIFLLREKLGRTDFVKIIDFGVSKFTVGELRGSGDATHSAAVLGTPHYMAPEQLRDSSAVDARADLYSAGVILYKAITGKAPYKADSLADLIFQMVEAPPAPVAALVPGVDPQLVAIVDRAMQQDVTARFQTADEFLASLDRWLMTSAPSPLPRFNDDGPIEGIGQGAARVERGANGHVHIVPARGSARTGVASGASLLTMSTMAESGEHDAKIVAGPARPSAQAAVGPWPVGARAAVSEPASEPSVRTAEQSSPTTQAGWAASPASLPPVRRGLAVSRLGIVLSLLVGALAASAAVLWLVLSRSSELRASEHAAATEVSAPTAAPSQTPSSESVVQQSEAFPLPGAVSENDARAADKPSTRGPSGSQRSPASAASVHALDATRAQTAKPEQSASAPNVAHSAVPPDEPGPPKTPPAETREDWGY